MAIVGSRAPTGAGKEFARDLAADLAFQGVTVVSGMARGIDASAHEGALAAGGETVAVLGCGVDVLYPPEAGRLREAILGRGRSVITSYSIHYTKLYETPPLVRLSLLSETLSRRQTPCVY